jgi:4-amino-4-deoxychorismate lyase
MSNEALTVKYENTIAIHADDRILLGDGLFETLKVVNKTPCFPDLHWSRIKKSAESLGIAFDVTYPFWIAMLHNAIESQNYHVDGLKVILSAGRALRSLESLGHDPWMLCQTFSYAPSKETLRLVSASWRRDAKNPLYQIKSINYLEAILARRDAISSGADDALFFNLDEHATDTTVANLVVIQDDEVITPKVTDGVLPGITRGRLQVLCKSLSVPFREMSVSREMLATADALFVTNALFELRAISSFDGKSFLVNHPLMGMFTQALETKG